MNPGYPKAAVFSCSTFNHNLCSPVQILRGFTLSELRYKLWSQEVPSPLPPWYDMLSIRACFADMKRESPPAPVSGSSMKALHSDPAPHPPTSPPPDKPPPPAIPPPPLPPPFPETAATRFIPRPFSRSSALLLGLFRSRLPGPFWSWPSSGGLPPALFNAASTACASWMSREI